MRQRDERVVSNALFSYRWRHTNYRSFNTLRSDQAQHKLWSRARLFAPNTAPFRSSIANERSNMQARQLLSSGQFARSSPEHPTDLGANSIAHELSKTTCSLDPSSSQSAFGWPPIPLVFHRPVCSLPVYQFTSRPVQPKARTPVSWLIEIASVCCNHQMAPTLHKQVHAQQVQLVVAPNLTKRHGNTNSRQLFCMLVGEPAPRSVWLDGQVINRQLIIDRPGKYAGNA